MTLPERYRPTALEIAAGVMLGRDREVPELPEPPAEMTPLAALEAAVRPALERSPCLVSFSGGRDSSAVLAVAARVARREGLPLPIPATLRFPLEEKTDESEWQERVVAYLDLEEWIRLDFEDELDCLGPYGQRVLTRTGVLFPIAGHSLVPLLDLAGGGSVLTGTGGDEVFSWQSRVNDLLRRRARPRLRDVLPIGLALSPTPVQRYVARRRLPFEWTWLTETALAELRDLWASEANVRPSFDFQLRRLWRSRGFQATLASLQAIGDDAGVLVTHPFCDPGFIGSVAKRGGRRGFGGRTATMRAFFSGILPEAVIERTTKAVFNVPFWRRHTRQFVQSWTGEGIDPELVHVDVLRVLWAEAESAPVATLAQLKAAWLAKRPRGSGSDLE